MPECRMRHATARPPPTRRPHLASARRQFYRLLHPDGISCYYRELLRRYAALLAYPVQAPGEGWTPLDTGIINALKSSGVQNTVTSWR